MIATGNPCPTLDAMEESYQVSQCNNALVFPGVGLGVLASGAREVLPDFFTAAAYAIAEMMTPEELAKGRLMPSIGKIRQVGKKVALAVAMSSVKAGVSRPCVYSDFQHDDDEARMKKLIDRIRWKPEYLPLVAM